MIPIARALICLALCACLCAQADEPSLDLGTYRHSASYVLPASLGEVSAVTWNWDDNSLYVLDDEARAISRISTQGALFSSMKLSGFDDTEGLTYIGNGQFVLTEERLQSAYLLKYVAGAALVRSALPVVTLGPKVGNVGLEGISFDRGTGHFIVVKEKDPLTVTRAELHFGTIDAAGTLYVVDEKPSLHVLTPTPR